MRSKPKRPTPLLPIKWGKRRWVQISLSLGLSGFKSWHLSFSYSYEPKVTHHHQLPWWWWWWWWWWWIIHLQILYQKTKLHSFPKSNLHIILAFSPNSPSIFVLFHYSFPFLLIHPYSFFKPLLSCSSQFKYMFLSFLFFTFLNRLPIILLPNPNPHWWMKIHLKNSINIFVYFIMYNWPSRYL